MTDRPPENSNLVITAGGLSRRAIAIVAAIGIIGIAAALILPGLFETKDAFPDSGNGISGTTRIGTPYAVGLGAPDEAIDLLDAAAIVAPDSAGAAIDVVVCSAPTGTVIGSARGAAAIDDACGAVLPVAGTHLGADTEVDGYLLLVAVPLEAGAVHVTGVDVTYDTGWRDTTETVDLDVTVRAR